MVSVFLSLVTRLSFSSRMIKVNVRLQVPLSSLWALEHISAHILVHIFCLADHRLVRRTEMGVCAREWS